MLDAANNLATRFELRHVDSILTDLGDTQRQNVLPALAGLVCGSVITAPYGARLAHRLPVLTIKRIFAGLLYVLATKMLISYA